MKIKTILIALVICLSVTWANKASAQATEIAQLLLNVEKLAQFKQILTDMKRGYDILHGGYNTIKNLSEGNFSLHKTFLDGLLEASPAVKRYYKVPKIIEYQIGLVRSYKAALERFRQSGQFRPEELGYLEKVYGNLLSQSLRNLDELVGVVTSGKLRMSDDERLAAIDRIYADMEEKVVFLKSFNDSNSMLALQRRSMQNEVEGLKQWQGIK